MKDRKKTIEKVLGISITQEQLTYVKHYWRAFYDNPTGFAGSVVVDMVLMALGENDSRQDDSVKSLTSF